MRPADEIYALASERMTAVGKRQAKQREIAQTYNGEVVLPLPELDAYETSAIANTLKQGVDGPAQRAASTLPELHYPSARVGFKNHDDIARERRRANLGWWEHNTMDLVLAKRYRHLIAYATSPVRITLDRKARLPLWTVRSPLDAYPAPGNELHPADCIFIYQRTAAYIRKTYPGALGFLAARTDFMGQPLLGDEMVQLIEYIDDTETVLCVSGQATGRIQNVQSDYPTFIIKANAGSAAYVVELERTANLAGTPLVVVPGRITLGDPIGAVDELPGMQVRAAKLDALEYRAIVEGVFPTTWMVSHPNSNGARIVKYADGMRGIIGEVEGGTLIAVNPQPSYMANQAMDRLERAERQNGNIPAPFGGELPTNVRTGKALDGVVGNQSDPGIAELQKLMARSMQVENEIGAATQRALVKSAVSFYVSWKGGVGWADYTPPELFDGTEVNLVTYPMPGTDLNGQVIRHSQKVGAGLWSKRTAREKDPETDDAEREHDRVTTEALEGALLAGITARVQALDQGGLDPADLAELMTLIGKDSEELAPAYMKINERAKKRQADALAAQQAQAGPQAALAPGMGAPGQGTDALAQQGIAIPPAGPSTQDLSGLLSALRRPQRALPQEAQVA